MNTIINPNTNKRYSIFSKQGKQILKNMVSSFIGGMYTQIDYDDYKLNKTVRGKDGCHVCDNLNRLHANKQITLRKPSLEFMKKTCTDCAEQNCNLYIKGTKLGLSNLSKYKDNCNKYLTNAEKAKKALMNRRVSIKPLSSGLQNITIDDFNASAPVPPRV